MVAASFEFSSRARLITIKILHEILYRTGSDHSLPEIDLSLAGPLG